MKLNKRKWKRCFHSREGHDFVQKDLLVIQKDERPFKGEVVVLRALECKKCGEKQVQVFQEGDPEWKDYNY